MARLCPAGKYLRALDLLEEDFPRGLEALEGLARTYAKDPTVRAALGTAYLDDELPFEALPHLEWAERKDPTPAVQDALLATYLALDMLQHAMRLAARSGRAGLGDAAAPEPDPAHHVVLPTQDRLAFERARTGMFYGDPTAAPALERLRTKHPGYQPVRNLLVTFELLQGDLEGYVAAAGEAFALAPDDPHALLNAVRAAFLKDGVEGARALRPHADALEPDPGWGGDRYLARAGALALMDDADATEAAMDAYHDWVDGTGDEAQAALADAIDDLLERRAHDPRAPLVDLAELVVGLPRRWERQGAEHIRENVEASLAAMPGVVHELADQIGYQATTTVRFLAFALLTADAVPSPHGAWPAVLEHVARHGPGTLEARHALWSVLVDTGRIADDEALPTDLATVDEEGDDDVVLPEVPDVEELATLRVLEERWCLAVRPAVFMMGEDPEPTLTWLGSLAADGGFVRVATFEEEPFDADSLFALVARACIGGMVDAEPGRPQLVSVEDAELVAVLAERLAPLGIDVVVGDVEPALVAMHGVTEALGSGAPAWLAEAEEEPVQDFFDAVIAFYEAEPWRRFHSDRFLAYRVGEGPWRYAQVMGQAATEYGVAVYPGWDEAQAFVEDAGEDEEPAAERLAAIGWLEGLSLTAVDALSPLDAGRYLVSDMEPDVDGTVPAWLRFEADGPALPEHGPGVYAVLVALLADHARRAKKQVRRIDATADTPAGPLRVVYPATGEEAVVGGGGSGASEP